jgi:hypothetical protein
LHESTNCLVITKLIPSIGWILFSVISKGSYDERFQNSKFSICKKNRKKKVRLSRAGAAAVEHRNFKNITAWTIRARELKLGVSKFFRKLKLKFYFNFLKFWSFSRYFFCFLKNMYVHLGEMGSNLSFNKYVLPGYSKICILRKFENSLNTFPKIL